MTEKRAFTKAHRRALDWLPSDGAWRIQPGSVSQALHSLWLYHRDLLDEQVGPFGKRGGHCSRYRLTPLGIATKAALADIPELRQSAKVLAQ